jgi:predicted protein tyrosine phosphatase
VIYEDIGKLKYYSHFGGINKMQKSPERITKITSNIYLGGYFYVDYSQNKLKKMLKELGVTDIINCAEEIPFYVSTDDNMNYIKFAWEDISNFNLFPSIEAAELHLNKLVTLVNSKSKNNYNHIVYVHCAMGISRSASLIIFHLMKRKNMSYDQAYNFVKQRRVSIEPNFGFKSQLIAYDHRRNLTSMVT